MPGETLPGVDALHQLQARSQREIEAHGPEQTSPYFVLRASSLLASLRLWAQSSGRTDEDVRAVLSDDDPGAGHAAVVELAAVGTEDARTAARMIGAILGLPLQERWAIIATALQVWRVSTSE
jgi:hypothetical protein